MRRVLLLLAVLLVATLACLADDAQAEQTPWQPRLSLYSGQFGAPTFLSKNIVLATGPGGILRSEDGGHSWSWALNAMISDLQPAGDGQHALAIGYGGAIFATADGGRTWSRQQSGTDLDLFDIAAFDSRSAIVLGQHFTYGCIPTNNLSPYVISRTDDGGQSWQAVSFPSNYQPSKLMVVAGGNRAWLAARRCTPNTTPGTIGNCTWEPATFRSDDRGRSWTRIDQAPQYWSPTFASADVGWVLDTHALRRTEDGGKSWHTVREWTELGSYISDLNVLGEDTLVLVETDRNSNSQIIKATDAGKTWSNIGQPEKGYGSLKYFDEQHAVRADWNLAPLSWSDDGGVTWHAAQTPVFAINFNVAFDFVDSTNGWAAGTKLLRTRDGGLSWEPISDVQPIALEFVSPIEGWAIETRCADSVCTQYLIHTTDGGVTWQEHSSFGNSGLPVITFVDPLNGWVQDGRGPQYPVLHTRDGGRTWLEQHQPGYILAFVDANTVWAAGDAPGNNENEKQIYVSRDGGDSWSQAGTLQSQSEMELAAADSSHAWAVSDLYRESESGESTWEFTLYRTTDGGAHWQQIGEKSKDRYFGLKFFTPSNGVVMRSKCPEDAGVGCQSDLMRTFDGGLTWNSEATGNEDGFVYAFDDLWRGWAARALGMYDIASISLYSYSATPQVLMPSVGQAHSEEDIAPSFAALGVLGAMLVGVGGFVRLRSRREGKTGG